MGVRTSTFSITEARCEPRIRAVSELLGLSFTTPRLILEVLVHSGLAPILVAVSDHGTLRGLTQFATQFGFTGSATSP